jgi:hypothetical protein
LKVTVGYDELGSRGIAGERQYAKDDEEECSGFGSVHEEEDERLD